MMALGARIGYFSGDPLRLLEDAQILKPHYFPSVPRILNRLYQAAMAGGNVPGLKGKLFKTAVETKIRNLRTTGQVTHPFWDALVFRKVRNPFILILGDLFCNHRSKKLWEVKSRPCCLARHL